MISRRIEFSLAKCHSMTHFLPNLDKMIKSHDLFFRLQTGMGVLTQTVKMMVSYNNSPGMNIKGWFQFEW